MPSIPQPTTDGREASTSASERTSVDLYDLLWRDPGINPARPVLMALLYLDSGAADFLAAVIYWTLKMDGPFYKFNNVCGHAGYRAGDSWMEELGMGEKAFYHARSTVATKNTTGHDLAATLATPHLTSLVIYWTDDARMTWYDLNLDLLCDHLSAALGLTVTVGKRPPSTQRTPSRTPGARAAADSATPNSLPKDEGCTGPTVTAAQHDRAQVERRPASDHHPAPGREHTTGDYGDKPAPGGLSMKTATGRVTYIHINKKEEGDRRGFSEVVLHISQRLQKEGVFEVPACEIALRAHEAGLDAQATIDLFHAHLRDVKQTHKARAEQISIATWRMKEWPLCSRISPTSARRTTSERFLDALHQAPIPSSPHCRPDAAQALSEPDDVPELPFPLDTPDPMAAEPPVAREPRRLWNTVLGDIQLQMSRATFERWLKGTTLTRTEEGIYTVSTTNPYAVEWLEHRLHRLIERTLERHTGEPVAVEFDVAPSSGSTSGAPL